MPLLLRLRLWEGGQGKGRAESEFLPASLKATGATLSSGLLWVRQTQRNSLMRLAALTLSPFPVTSPPFLSARLERPLCLAPLVFQGSRSPKSLPRASLLTAASFCPSCPCPGSRLHFCHVPPLHDCDGQHRSGDPRPDGLCERFHRRGDHRAAGQHHRHGGGECPRGKGKVVLLLDLAETLPLSAPR